MSLVSRGLADPGRDCEAVAGSRWEVRVLGVEGRGTVRTTGGH